MLISGFTGFSQTQKVTLSKEKLGTVECEYALKIDLEKSDTTKVIYITFQNEAYKSLTSISAIGFYPTTEKEVITNFIMDLKAAMPEIGKKTTLSWERKYYSLHVYDWKNAVSIQEPKSGGNGYTYLTKKQAEKLIEWFSKIGYNG